MSVFVTIFGERVDLSGISESFSLVLSDVLTLCDSDTYGADIKEEERAKVLDVLRASFFTIIERRTVNPYEQLRILRSCIGSIYRDACYRIIIGRCDCWAERISILKSSTKRILFDCYLNQKHSYKAFASHVGLSNSTLSKAISWQKTDKDNGSDFGLFGHSGISNHSLSEALNITGAFVGIVNTELPPGKFIDRKSAGKVGLDLRRAEPSVREYFLISLTAMISKIFPDIHVEENKCKKIIAANLSVAFGIGQAGHLNVLVDRVFDIISKTQRLGVGSVEWHVLQKPKQDEEEGCYSQPMPSLAVGSLWSNQNGSEPFPLFFPLGQGVEGKGKFKVRSPDVERSKSRQLSHLPRQNEFWESVVEAVHGYCNVYLDEEERPAKVIPFRRKETGNSNEKPPEKLRGPLNLVAQI